jgi:hypothetical protein
MPRSKRDGQAARAYTFGEDGRLHELRVPGV